MCTFKHWYSSIDWQIDTQLDNNKQRVTHTHTFHSISHTVCTILYHRCTRPFKKSHSVRGLSPDVAGYARTFISRHDGRQWRHLQLAAEDVALVEEEDKRRLRKARMSTQHRQGVQCHNQVRLWEENSASLTLTDIKTRKNKITSRFYAGRQTGKGISCKIGIQTPCCRNGTAYDVS